MPAYILTGAPGSGKTAILRVLETHGHPVVEEAATGGLDLVDSLAESVAVERHRGPAFRHDRRHAERDRSGSAGRYVHVHARRGRRLDR